VKVRQRMKTLLEGIKTVADALERLDDMIDKLEDVHAVMKRGRTQFSSHDTGAVGEVLTELKKFRRGR
jgi:uncharacterized protein with GYD domain